MRYIFRDTEGEEKVISLNSVKNLENGNILLNIEDKNYYVKKIGRNHYLSTDQLTWKKIAILPSNKDVVFVDQTYKVYRGFKPSGLVNSNPGSLLTQMPGKVVKINVKVGDQVKAGQTLLILEAMKMENEIKAGIDGKVKLLNISIGQALESGHLMIELE